MSTQRFVPDIGEAVRATHDLPLVVVACGRLSTKLRLAMEYETKEVLTSRFHIFVWTSSACWTGHVFSLPTCETLKRNFLLYCLSENVKTLRWIIISQTVCVHVGLGDLDPYHFFLQEHMKLSILVLVTRDTNVFCFVLLQEHAIISIGLGDLDSEQG